MFNIIKMDLYKMFKSRSFYTLNIILILVVLSMSFLIRTTLTMDYEKAQQSNIRYHRDADKLSTNDPSITEEEYNDTITEAKDTMDVNEFMLFQYSEFMISILLAIFISIFICSELDSGFIKNIIPLKNSRISLIISKNIIVALFIVIQAGVAIVASIVSNLIISGKVNVSGLKELIIYLGLQMVLRLAFASLIIFISYLFRSKSTSISIGILLSLNVHGLFLKLLDKTINTFNFDLSKLSIVGNISIFRFSPEDYQRIIIISIAYFLLYNITSVMRVKRMEVN